MRDRVDDLMAQDKTFAEGSWSEGPYLGCKRWRAQLLDAVGVGTELRVVLDNYPSLGFEKTTIQVVHYGLQDRPVMRLCMGADARHHNRPRRRHPLPAAVEQGWLTGPHCHRWSDNRHLCAADRLPDDLLYAREIAHSIATFDATFREFCSIARIICRSEDIPALPSRDTLF